MWAGWAASSSCLQDEVDYSDTEENLKTWWFSESLMISKQNSGGLIVWDIKSINEIIVCNQIKSWSSESSFREPASCLNTSMTTWWQSNHVWRHALPVCLNTSSLIAETDLTLALKWASCGSKTQRNEPRPPTGETTWWDRLQLIGLS